MEIIINEEFLFKLPPGNELYNGLPLWFFNPRTKPSVTAVLFPARANCLLNADILSNACARWAKAVISDAKTGKAYSH